MAGEGRRAVRARHARARVRPPGSAFSTPQRGRGRGGRGPRHRHRARRRELRGWLVRGPNARCDLGRPLPGRWDMGRPCARGRRARRRPRVRDSSALELPASSTCARAGSWRRDSLREKVEEIVRVPHGPHDEVHVVALRAVLHGVLGEWATLAGFRRGSSTPRARTWTTRASSTGARSSSAPWLRRTAATTREARRLEELGQEGVLVFGPREREPALLRLALLRGELEATERIIEALPANDAFGVDGPAARLDALTALGDRARVEEEAARFVGERSYTRPFAIRALGRVRRGPRTDRVGRPRSSRTWASAGVSRKRSARAVAAKTEGVASIAVVA